jgi:predicted Rossmann fold flavoprotein
MKKADVIIIGAGAAGLMCAIEAGKRGRQVLVLDHANKIGKKIIMSGGGRCNFTNLHSQPTNYISHNPHFCKSALSRFTQWDFVELVKRYRIPFHEKTLGQLFCDHKSKAILEMLLAECERACVSIQTDTIIEKIEKCADYQYELKTTRGTFQCESLVIATGGLSIPTMGASPFGYKVAEQFGMTVWPTRAGLVPFTLHSKDKEKLSVLSGISIASVVSNIHQSFRENILFTHRGLSGPAILQISSYWQAGEKITINMLPDLDVLMLLKSERQQHPSKQLNTFLTKHLPKRVVETLFAADKATMKLVSLSNYEMVEVSNQINAWQVLPNSTEGYRTAEVTLGGVDCNDISSKTMQANHFPGLYFIGEVLDVTGWLGGFNFQWAWSSGWAAGQAV